MLPEVLESQVRTHPKQSSDTGRILNTVESVFKVKFSLYNNEIVLVN